jgi:hypothetical protein
MHANTDRHRLVDQLQPARNLVARAEEAVDDRDHLPRVPLGASGVRVALRRMFEG